MAEKSYKKMALKKHPTSKCAKNFGRYFVTVRIKNTTYSVSTASSSREAWRRAAQVFGLI